MNPFVDYPTAEAWIQAGALLREDGGGDFLAQMWASDGSHVQLHWSLIPRSAYVAWRDAAGEKIFSTEREGLKLISVSKRQGVLSFAVECELGNARSQLTVFVSDRVTIQEWSLQSRES